MSGGPPYMKFFPADYIAGTRHLSTLQKGIYTELLWNYWMKGGLPNDDVKLARIAGLSLKAWLANKDDVADFFEPGWHHKRMDDVLREAIGRSQSMASRGEKGGRAKALKSKDVPLATATLEAVDARRSYISEPEPEEEKKEASPPKKAPPERLGSRFEKGAPLTDEWRAAAISGGLPEQVVEREFASFSDYWVGKAGAGGRKADWLATWRNWCRRTADRVKPFPARPKTGMFAHRGM